MRLAPHVPVHLGSMQYAVLWQHEHWKGNLKEGDVLVSNHPSMSIVLAWSTFANTQQSVAVLICPTLRSSRRSSVMARLSSMSPPEAITRISEESLQARCHPTPLSCGKRVLPSKQSSLSRKASSMRTRCAVIFLRSRPSIRDAVVPETYRTTWLIFVLRLVLIKRVST